MTTVPDDGPDLVARYLPPRPPPGTPCPDESTLVAYAEDRLPSSVRQATEAHLVGCASCRAALGWALDAAEGPATVARASSARWMLPWALAAGVLLGLGAALWRPWESVPSSATPAPDRLLALAERLGRADPEVWRGFRPQTAEDLARTTAPVERGDAQILQPRGTVLVGRPPYTWHAPGASAGTLTVRDAAGQVIFSPTLVENDLLGGSLGMGPGEPELPAGTYVVTLKVELPLGQADVRSTFRVATPEERALAARASTLARRTDREWGTLAYAQWAFQREMFVEAHMSAVDVAMHFPENPLALVLVQATERRGGWTAAGGR